MSVSICSAARLDQIDTIERAFLNSATTINSDVVEINLCYQDLEEIPAGEVLNGVQINRFSVYNTQSYYHALSLHKAIDEAKGEFILMSDTDVLFYEDVVALYKKCHSNGYHFSGVNHIFPELQAMGDFPCVINFFAAKSDLPGPDFLQGRLKMRKNINEATEDGEIVDGKYLVQSPIKEYMTRFPNWKPPVDWDTGINIAPESLERVYWDTGCNLYLWAYLNQMEWISFGHVNLHDYFSDIVVGTMREPLHESTTLLHHKSVFEGEWEFMTIARQHGFA